MRTSVAVCAMILGLTGCHASDTGPVRAVQEPTAAPPTAIGSAGPAAPAYRLLRTRSVPATSQGLVLHGDHVAYAQDESRLVWMDWRTGATRTVYRSTYGSLFLLTVSGRYAEVVDERPAGAGGDAPDSPHRYVQLDLRSGRTSLVDPLPPGAQLVGELNDVRIETVRVPYHQRQDLVAVPQVPDPQLRHRITSDGRVVQASFDNRHRVVWTQRPAHGQLDGHAVLTRDLLRPDLPPVVLAQSPTDTMSFPVVGSGFVGWVQGGHLQLVSPAGGAVARVDDPLAVAAAPAADRHRVAVVVGHSGTDQLLVLRVGPGDA